MSSFELKQKVRYGLKPKELEVICSYCHSFAPPESDETWQPHFKLIGWEKNNDDITVECVHCGKRFSVNIRDKDGFFDCRNSVKVLNPYNNLLVEAPLDV